MNDRELISEFTQEPMQVEPFEEDERVADAIDDIQYRPGPENVGRQSVDAYSDPTYGVREPASSVPPAHLGEPIRVQESLRAKPLMMKSMRTTMANDTKTITAMPMPMQKMSDAAGKDDEQPIYHRSAAGAPDSDSRHLVGESANDEPDAATANIMEQYITHYERGAPNYEERRNILSDESETIASSLGEYGIGANYKNGDWAPSSQVKIAMDVGHLIRRMTKTRL